MATPILAYYGWTRIEDSGYHMSHEHRTCALCNSNQVEDAQHVLLHCPAHEGARRSLVSKLPPQLQDLSARGVFHALMGSSELPSLCPDGPIRRGVLVAIKAFWVAAFTRRDSQ